jgi:hypothetical protein
MSEIANLDEARERVRRKALKAMARSRPPVTDNERVSVIIESIKLAYEAIVDLFERVETIEKRAKLLAAAKNPGS